MGNFLCIICRDPFPEAGEEMFQKGIQATKRVSQSGPTGTVGNRWVRAASFPRWNGTGTPAVVDIHTGSWVIAVGSWFHRDGFASGSEKLLLARYLETGIECLAGEMDGFFVIILGDGRTGDVWVITDPAGSCHCFQRKWEQGVALSGSSFVLATLGEFRLDPVGCQEFLTSNTIFEDRTFYREVRKISPATISRFARGNLVSESRYWRAVDVSPDALDGEEAVSGLAERLADVAMRIAATYPRPVLDLTGGYDSRALAAAFLNAGVPFWTTVSGPPESPDVRISRGLASAAGLPHLYVADPQAASLDDIKEALAFTDGEFDLIEYARILGIHKVLRNQFDVSVNGSFGGLARALWWELLWPRIGNRTALDPGRLAAGRYLPRGCDPALFPPGVGVDLRSHYTSVVERLTAGLQGLPNTMQMDHANLMMRIHRWQGRIATATNRLWPCLSPFGFRGVLETVFASSPRIRLRSLLVRKMLSRYQPVLAEYPLDRGYPAVPLAWGNAHRFFPVVTNFARRVTAKLGRISRLVHPPAGRPGAVPLRVRLWSDDEVRTWLDPGGMRTADLVDRAALAGFMEKSRRNGFMYDQQWGRILSLEYTLREHDRIRRGFTAKGG